MQGPQDVGHGERHRYALEHEFLGSANGGAISLLAWTGYVNDGSGKAKRCSQELLAPSKPGKLPR